MVAWRLKMFIGLITAPVGPGGQIKYIQLFAAVVMSQ